MSQIVVLPCLPVCFNVSLPALRLRENQAPNTNPILLCLHKALRRGRYRAGETYAWYIARLSSSTLYIVHFFSILFMLRDLILSYFNFVRFQLYIFYFPLTQVDIRVLHCSFFLFRSFSTWLISHFPFSLLLCSQFFQLVGEHKNYPKHRNSISPTTSLPNSEVGS